MFSKESAFPAGSGNPFLSVLRYAAHPSKGEIFSGGGVNNCLQIYMRSKRGTPDAFLGVFLVSPCES